ncbi:hypothetical protein K503DRAFT_411249 [Rhizopogon vinicolor AM-OR11-026]|uniref:Protein-S-isoprenylcysteine O-methyltransferase n=1 Tax=Rhizopogon vinicolor AM-OR11-026 TaxID=1314800 RepID=A0A1B7MQN1_9AGAM|nr:hypothetical protein K503DRAFT_411249 [Rhizopogon vinicolor AM-OR11-026]
MVAGKVCLLICATGAQLYSLTPPNPTPDSKERLKPTGLELTISWLPIFMKTIPIACVLAEIFVAFATAHESAISKSVTSLLIHSPLFPDFDFTLPSAALVAGFFLSIIGAVIRSHCYRTLGRLFTFELSIRQGHKLVTSGPYSIVRHPSYSGMWCFFLGIMLCHLHPRSWLVSCSGVFPSSDQAVKWILACIWMALCSFWYILVGGRVRREEAMLEEYFGDDWRRYTKKVPYRLVPWLY